MDYSEIPDSLFESMCKCLPEYIIINDKICGRILTIGLRSTQPIVYFKISYVWGYRINELYFSKYINETESINLIEVYDTNPYHCIELTLNRLQNIGYEKNKS